MSTRIKNNDSARQLSGYLEDRFLRMLFQDIRSAGKIKASSIDVTDKCNLRCKGCYFFEGRMDRPGINGYSFDHFIEDEKARGTNYFTVLGGEPSLVLDRVKKLYDNFHVIVVSNGLIKIPYSGFENMPIALSVWGDNETDMQLRGGGKVDVFSKALGNYQNDDRVVWYFTVTSGNAAEIETVTEKCIINGNYIGYNFYGDISGLGGKYDHRNGFGEVSEVIDAMIAKYPERVLNTSYLNRILTSGWLFDEQWGYDVCSSITFDHESNTDRVRNGKFYNKHFRAYNADLVSTRKCCVGTDRQCANCFDIWAHYSWIIGNMRKHLRSKADFTNWLTTTYVFYLVNRIIDYEDKIQFLPDLHRITSTQTCSEKDRWLIPN